MLAKHAVAVDWVNQVTEWSSRSYSQAMGSKHFLKYVGCTNGRTGKGDLSNVDIVKHYFAWM